MTSSSSVEYEAKMGDGEGAEELDFLDRMDLLSVCVLELNRCSGRYTTLFVTPFCNVHVYYCIQVHRLNNFRPA